jgi:hypothetical protein
MLPAHAVSVVDSGAWQRRAGGRRTRGGLDLETMHLKAVVKHGRIVIDEPTELPEGTQLVLAVVDEGDDMDESERARLHESLRRSIAQAKAGQLIDGDEVIDRLLARP